MQHWPFVTLTHLFSAESLCFPRSRVGERALNLPKEQGKSLHSPLSKGRELHAPGWGPFLVSPISTCFKYFKSHSGHVCHFAELIYARLYLFQIVVVALFLVYIKREKTFFLTLYIILIYLRYVYYFIFPIFNCSLFVSYKLFNIAGWQLVMANMIPLLTNPTMIIIYWPFVTSVNMVTNFIHCVFVMKKLLHSTSANRVVFSNVSTLTSI
ncbi:hypothetical protein T4B_6851 [Trichinella pseudospiralis]|uniref:Uncharacterized protein n=1 Tax=Trichinella pseudospiralis TaxID=6337 RepID=A0A0V1GP93_TRIPS|nr:hypothetical protein T4B_6851 [Trichinella pseudospiralis]